MPADAHHRDGPLLVLGYGNTLRRDDSAGPLLAEEIAAEGYPGVYAVACAQLSPEHAAWVAEAGAVVFVDAMVGGDERVRLLPLDPVASGQVRTHGLIPEALLGLARDIYGHTPRAWLLPVPAEDFRFGEQLSALTQAGMAEARRVLDHFIQYQLARRAAHECALAGHY
jgi:hydrogenase maturation protease